MDKQNMGSYRRYEKSRKNISIILVVVLGISIGFVVGGGGLSGVVLGVFGVIVGMGISVFVGQSIKEDPEDGPIMLFFVLPWIGALIFLVGLIIGTLVMAYLGTKNGQEEQLFAGEAVGCLVGLIIPYISHIIMTMLKMQTFLSYAISKEDLDNIVNRARLTTFHLDNIAKLLSEAFLLALTEGRIQSAEILKSQELFSTQILIETIPTIRDQQTLKALAKIEPDLIFQHLETAIENNDIDRVKFLQECGIEPIKVMVKQASPEMRLALMGDKIKKAFEEKDINYLKTAKDYDIVLTSEQKTQAFTIAVEKQDFAYAEELLKSILDVSKINLSDFVKGILLDDLTMFRQGLLEGKIPSDLWDNKHALIHACNNGQIKLLEVAAQEVKDINALCVDGDALLHAVTRYNMPSVVKILLERGADINIKNREGRTPVYLAAEAKLPEVGLLLFNAGGNV
ncbi:MAG: ankyrin repeat domain-containing protein [Brevinema sp.]